jgi:hypothetical protein
VKKGVDRRKIEELVMFCDQGEKAVVGKVMEFEMSRMGCPEVFELVRKMLADIRGVDRGGGG